MPAVTTTPNTLPIQSLVPGDVIRVMRPHQTKAGMRGRMANILVVRIQPHTVWNGQHMVPAEDGRFEVIGRLSSKEGIPMSLRHECYAPEGEVEVVEYAHRPEPLTPAQEAERTLVEAEAKLDSLRANMAEASRKLDALRHQVDVAEDDFNAAFDRVLFHRNQVYTAVGGLVIEGGGSFQ